MGTRHLTAVAVDGELKVAQYGQWDGYPGGAGLDVLNFLYKADLEDFAGKVRSLHWYSEEDHMAALENLGAPDGLLTMEQADEFSKEYPELSRDTGSDILKLIAAGSVSAVRDSRDFALDGLFCEYAYVIDLDRKVLEVYEGFKKMPVAGRWAGQKETADSDYGAVDLIKEYSLDDLPTNEQFLKELEPDEEDEDA